MRLPFLFLLGLIQASPIPNPKFVQLKFQSAKRDLNGQLIFHPRHSKSFQIEDLQRRDQRLFKRNTALDAVVMSNDYTLLYVANISLGASNPQNLSVQIDTGSSDFWVYAADNPYCGGSDSASGIFKRDEFQSLFSTYEEPSYTELDSYLESDLDLQTDGGIIIGGGSTSSTDDDEITATPTTNDVQSTTFSYSLASVTTSSSSIKHIISQIANHKIQSITPLYPEATGSTYESLSFASLTPQYLTKLVQTYVVNTDLISDNEKVDCNAVGDFDSSKSSSCNKTNNPFVISYGDNSFAQGIMATDQLNFGEYTLPDYSFGLAEYANASMNLFGIGLISNEALGVYDNLPFRLVTDGYINRPLYSLYLDNINSSTGTILFGAVDTNRYVGKLTTFPIVTYYGETGPSEFIITLDSLSIEYSDNSSTINTLTSAKHPFLLDSGTSYTALPESILTNIGITLRPLGISWFNNYDMFIGRCEDIEKVNFNFNFQGTNYTIPASFLSYTINNLTELGNSFPKELKKENGDKYCSLPFFASDDDKIIAGDLVLRWFYVVYDMAYYQISLAQASFNDDTNSNVKIIEANEKLPDSQYPPNYNTLYVGEEGHSDSETTLTGVFPTGMSFVNDGNSLLINWGVSLLLGLLSFI